MNEYEQQAQDFLTATGTTIECVKLGTFPYFDDEEETRDVFYVTIKRGSNVYSFKFGDSLNNTLDRLLASHNTPFGCQLVPTQQLFKHTNTRNQVQFYEWCKKNNKRLRAVPKQPTAYDILACLTIYDPGTFADFCANYGYETDSRKAEKVYFAVQEEYEGIRKLFTSDQLDQLQEIN